MQEGRTETEQMISEERLKEIAALPSQRDLAESNDQEANYRVGKLMAEAIRELLEERRLRLLQDKDLRKAAEIGAKNMKLWIQEGCGCGGDGHVCGIRRVQRELETVEKALEGKRICKFIRQDELGSCPSCGQVHENYAEKRNDEHDENCDTRDQMIKGKPCNCKRFCNTCGVEVKRGDPHCYSHI